MTDPTPVIIEVALNGETPRSRNASVPHTPQEIAADSIACIESGAAIIHNHMGDIRLGGEASADAYAAGWAPVLDRYPDAIFCPTSVIAATQEERTAHFAPCAARGARMGAMDPGVESFCLSGDNGMPGPGRGILTNGFDQIEHLLEVLGKAKLGPSLGIYEPGFLRAAIAYHRGGRMPPGAMIKLYFGGDHNPSDGKPGYSFGLPPTIPALEAYIDMIGDCDIPWAVAVPGGDVIATDMARHALERGGHLRIGIEDYAGSRQPDNVTLLAEAVALCQAVGRPVADCRTAAQMLRLP